jgi:hypothetical protein
MLADKTLETIKAPREVILMPLKILYVFVLLITSIIYLSQVGLFDNYAAVAQAVPLIPINSGNATLDQGLPVFYQCLEEVVDDSFSEQEDSYFQHEPRKSEVIECYYQVFVNNDVDSLSTEPNNFNENIEEPEVENEEEDGKEDGEDKEEEDEEGTLFG